MKRVQVTHSARLDLLEIWDHIARESTASADRVLSRIESEFDRIAAFPGIGHTREELGDEYRVWTVFSFLIVYRPDTKPIQVLRVVSGHRDLNQMSF